jgi:hypothetical protein
VWPGLFVFQGIVLAGLHLCSQNAVVVATSGSFLSDVKKEMQNESNRSDKDRDPEAVLGGF